MPVPHSRAIDELGWQRRDEEAEVRRWVQVRRAIGVGLAMVGLKRPINHLRFSVTRPPWWLDQRARRRFFRTMIPRGGLCFDVGAHEGASSALYLDLGARVVAVEPQPACAEQARQRLGDRPGRVVLEAAVGATMGRAPLWLVAEETQIASMDRAWIEAVQGTGRFPGRSWRDAIEVEVTTLDSLVAEYGLPDFLKIDVEGHEAEVLAGLSHPIPIVSFEFTPERRETALACLDRLHELGARWFQAARHDEWRFAWPAPRDLAAARRALATEEDGGPGGDVYAARSANAFVDVSR